MIITHMSLLGSSRENCQKNKNHIFRINMNNIHYEYYLINQTNAPHIHLNNINQFVNIKKVVTKNRESGSGSADIIDSLSSTIFQFYSLLRIDRFIHN